MNKLEFKKKLFAELEKKSHMVLSTSLNNRVTSRNISSMYLDGKIYFQTDEFLRNDYPMNHTMRLHEELYEMIEIDLKDIEYRLNDEKRQLIRIGDMIAFYKRPEEKEFIRTIVTDLKYYKDLLSMYSATFERDFKDRYDSPQSVVDDTPYYSEEEISEHGCVAIYLKRTFKANAFESKINE